MRAGVCFHCDFNDLRRRRKLFWGCFLFWSGTDLELDRTCHCRESCLNRGSCWLILGVRKNRAESSHVLVELVFRAFQEILTVHLVSDHRETRMGEGIVA